MSTVHRNGHQEKERERKIWLEETYLVDSELNRVILSVALVSKWIAAVAAAATAKKHCRTGEFQARIPGSQSLPSKYLSWLAFWPDVPLRAVALNDLLSESGCW